MSRKCGAAIVGNSVETIDLENARDKSRAAKMGVAYSVHPETPAASDETPAANDSDAEDRIDGIVEQDVDELLDRVEQAETA